MPNTYINNPLTGRQIRVGGNVFNRLILESHDFIDGRLVLRQDVSPPQDPPQYLNVNTGRMVQHGTRTYFGLFDARYEIIEDYYLIAPDDQELIDAIIMEDHQGGRRLTYNDINTIRAELNEIYSINFAEWIRRGERSRNPRTLEDHAPRLAAINVALCQECLMPENPSDLTDGCCKDCSG